MKYLLDTATFLHLIADRKDLLSTEAMQICEDTESALCLSTVSSWEIAIKYSIGKLEIREKPDRLIPEMILKMGLHQLPITLRHTLAVADLPFHHRDPFDRLLAAQARVENLQIITPDPIFRKYRVKVVW